ncbi:glycosyl hydrolase 53 family protein [Bdellovibrionota bacterium FG-2]
MSFATTYQPRFLFIGNENDFYYEQDSEDYARWVTFYNAAYVAIKAVSSTTLVGPIFNFEHLAGIGSLNAWNTPFWSALSAHDLTKIDLLGVTVYPWFSYASVAAVPDTYLQPLFDRIGSIPVAITESGWPAENFGNLNPLWSHSEQEQVDYVSKLFTFTQGHDVRMVNWLHLHYQVDDGTASTAWKIFGSVSLRNASGEARPALETWINK